MAEGDKLVRRGEGVNRDFQRREIGAKEPTKLLPA
jgi:hypothetical protein